MEAVTPDRFEQLKLRVHKLADDLQKMMIEQAEWRGKVDSAEQSIDRLRQTSATSEQVTSASTIMTLKLDHLLDRQVEMKHQIQTATRLLSTVFFLAVAALAWMAFK